MPRRRLLRHSWLTVPVFALAACTSDGGTDAPSSTTAPSSATPSTTPSVEITDAAALAAALRTGAAAVTTATLSISAGGNGSSCHVGGGATTSNGRLTGFQADGPAGADVAAEVSFADGTAYARTYDFDGPSDAAWHRVSAASADRTVVAVRSCLVAGYAVANVAPLADALAAGTGFERGGVVVGGERYRFDGFGAGAQGVLPALLGGEVVPTKAFVDVDPRGRLLEVYALLTVDGTSYSAKLDWSRFGAAVSPTSPAPGEIAAD